MCCESAVWLFIQSLLLVIWLASLASSSVIFCLKLSLNAFVIICYNIVVGHSVCLLHFFSFSWSVMVCGGPEQCPLRLIKLNECKIKGLKFFHLSISHARDNISRNWKCVFSMIGRLPLIRFSFVTIVFSWQIEHVLKLAVFRRVSVSQIMADRLRNLQGWLMLEFRANDRARLLR